MSAPPPCVVCGVDGSTGSVAAAGAAARAAVLGGAGLVLVRAFGWPADGVPGLPAGQAGRTAARRSATAELTRLAATVATGAPGTAITWDLVDGLPDVVLTAAARDAALLVVGAHGHSWPGGPPLGSVAAGVARRSGCPVLVHRARPGERLPARGPHRSDQRPDREHTVVVGVDGGPDTGTLLEAAAGAAEQTGATLVVLHARRATEGDPSEAGLSEADTGQRVRAAVAQLQRDHPRLPVTERDVTGAAPGLLVAASADAALVVVGRPDGPGPTLLHDTTRVLLRRARCPVVVVPLRWAS